MFSRSPRRLPVCADSFSFPSLKHAAAAGALALLGLARLAGAADPMAPVPPTSADPGLTVELVAQEPQLRTPTAVQVDAKGRVWVLENNTHFRPAKYDAPPTDRVLIFDQFSTDGRAGRVTVFAEGFSNGMGLRLLPDGDAIVTTRAEIFRLHDRDGNGHGDEKSTILRMDTADNYPHNGLSGTAISPDGWLYVGLGENHGSPWKITAADGTSVSGSDEGGVFRCDLLGRKLERWALGFWNPFGLTFDDAGRLFALDNDPGAGSLCRLLQVVRHADYGFRYRYGRTADHPFLSWFGQIRGTLGPLCLVGEAPTGLLQYHGTALGAPYDRDLLGCTWDDHGVQRFHLQAKGAGFTTQPDWLVRGGYYFRPTGIAQAPDGSVFVGDWVDGSYEVHGKGRLWRIRRTAPQPPGEPTAAPAPNADEQKLQALLAGRVPPEQAIALLATDDPYLLHGAIDLLAHSGDTAALQAHAEDADPKIRLGVLLAWRRSDRPEGREGLTRWLGDPNGAVRRAALQWIAEERLADWKDKAAASLQGQPSSLTFQSYLAALQLIESGKPDPKVSAAQTVHVALDPARPPELRALALRLAPVDHPDLTIPVLENLAREPDAGIRLEAVRILGARTTWEVQPVLRRIAADASAEPSVRAEALSALGKSAPTPENHIVLRQALASPDPKLRREALRSLRLVFDAEDAAQIASWIASLDAKDPANSELLEQISRLPVPAGFTETPAWKTARASVKTARPAPGEPWPELLSRTGDPVAGRRLFYHENGPRCFTCHTIEGRGGAVGPDLTHIRLQPEELLVAIREPSKDIAPAFQQWMLTMRDGAIGVGIDLFLDNKSQTTLIDATGKTTKYQNADVVKREALPVSIMPPGLDAQMTEDELRDLIAYLRAPRD